MYLIGRCGQPVLFPIQIVIPLKRLNLRVGLRQPAECGHDAALHTWELGTPIYTGALLLMFTSASSLLAQSWLPRSWITYCVCPWARSLVLTLLAVVHMIRWSRPGADMSKDPRHIPPPRTGCGSQASKIRTLPFRAQRHGGCTHGQREGSCAARKLGWVDAAGPSLGCAEHRRASGGGWLRRWHGLLPLDVCSQPRDAMFGDVAYFPGVWPSCASWASQLALTAAADPSMPMRLRVLPLGQGQGQREERPPFPLRSSFRNVRPAISRAAWPNICLRDATSCSVLRIAVSRSLLNFECISASVPGQTLACQIWYPTCRVVGRRSMMFRPPSAEPAETARHG